MMMEFSNTGWFMMVFMAIFWGFVIGAIILVGRSLTRSDQTDPALGNRKSAIEILKRRYAAGDISREEYEVKKCGLINALDVTRSELADMQHNKEASAMI